MSEEVESGGAGGGLRLYEFGFVEDLIGGAPGTPGGFELAGVPLSSNFRGIAG